MKVNIANYTFEFDDIRNITITNHTVLVDTINDFTRVDYESEEEIREAINWLQFNNLTRADIQAAITLIITTCTYYLNTKDQCLGCPLHKSQCILTDIPINWRE